MPALAGITAALHCRSPGTQSAGGGAAPRAPLAGAQRVGASLPGAPGGGARAKAPGPRGGVKTAPMRAGREQTCDTAGAAHGLQGRTARQVRRLRRTIRGRSGCASPRGLHPPQPARGTALIAACWRPRRLSIREKDHHSPPAGGPQARHQERNRATAPAQGRAQKQLGVAGGA